MQQFSNKVILALNRTKLSPDWLVSMCELGTSQTKLVAKLKPGETFGELALIRNTCERTATCIALQNNTTLRVHKRRDPVEIERVKKGLEVPAKEGLIPFLPRLYENGFHSASISCRS